MKCARWMHAPAGSSGSTRTARSKKEAVNRGAAIQGDRVFFVTADIHLVALDRRTGGVLWQKKYGSMEDGLFASAAPLVVGDKVMVGVAGGDTGMRGYVAAFSASTARRIVAHVHHTGQRRAGVGELGRTTSIMAARARGSPEPTIPN